MKCGLLFGAAAVVVASSLAEGGQGAPSPDTSRSFLALGGERAKGFTLPNGFRLERPGVLASYGLRWERYQQYQDGVPVLGGELTIHRDPSGEILVVIGDAYPRVPLLNARRMGPVRARRIARLLVGGDGEWRDRLMIDPSRGRLFYRLEIQRFFRQWHLWIDAENGRLLRRYDDLMTGEGVGVKGDVKDLTGLTIPLFRRYWLHSADGRRTVRDARSRPRSQLLGVLLPAFLAGPVAMDVDDRWNEPGRSAPGQAALVDAAYYLTVTDAYFQDVHGRNSFDGLGLPMVAVAHFSESFNNAFWNARYLVFGDGDGKNFREFTGALDVVAHEFTHGVTQYTSSLIYFGESGALNESFSDILGSTVEFYADARALDPAASPDWLISEDIDLRSDDAPGFRNMGDPAEDGDPDHYSERRTGSEDNGHVHSNSAIPNHAFYLLVNGGTNAGEARGHSHSGPAVDGIGLATAERIFYLGFTSLPRTADMCRARLATEAVADALFPASSGSVLDAWDAVGVPDDCGGG